MYICFFSLGELETKYFTFVNLIELKNYVKNTCSFYFEKLEDYEMKGNVIKGEFLGLNNKKQKIELKYYELASVII